MTKALMVHSHSIPAVQPEPFPEVPVEIITYSSCLPSSSAGPRESSSFEVKLAITTVCLVLLILTVNFVAVCWYWTAWR